MAKRRSRSLNIHSWFLPISSTFTIYSTPLGTARQSPLYSSAAAERSQRLVIPAKMRSRCRTTRGSIRSLPNARCRLPRQWTGDDEARQCVFVSSTEASRRVTREVFDELTWYTGDVRTQLDMRDCTKKTALSATTIIMPSRHSPAYASPSRPTIGCTRRKSRSSIRWRRATSPPGSGRRGCGGNAGKVCVAFRLLSFFQYSSMHELHLGV